MDCSVRSWDISLTSDMFLRTHSPMSTTPKAIQDLLDELESPKQSRLRAWNLLQGPLVGPFGSGRSCDRVTGRKTFYAEGAILEHALTKSLHLRNEAIKSLCSSVRRFRTRPSRKNAKAIIRTLFRSGSSTFWHPVYSSKFTSGG
jgi:hypothetical protein